MATNQMYPSIDLTNIPTTEKAPSRPTSKTSAKQRSASNLDAPVPPRNYGANGVQTTPRRKGRI